MLYLMVHLLESSSYITASACSYECIENNNYCVEWKPCSYGNSLLFFVESTLDDLVW